MKEKKQRRIVAVRGTALIINQIDKIQGPIQVYIEPSSIAICDTGHLKLYKHAQCITMEETETLKEKILVEDFSILLTITEEGEYEIDLQDSFDLFIQSTQDEFKKLTEENWLLFEFGLVRTKTIHSQLDIYKTLSFDALVNEFSFLSQKDNSPVSTLSTISEIVCKKCLTIKRKYVLEGQKENLEGLLEDIQEMRDNIAIKAYISDMLFSINNRLQEIIENRKPESEKIHDRIVELEKKKELAIGESKFEEAARLRDEIKLARTRLQQLATTKK